MKFVKVSPKKHDRISVNHNSPTFTKISHFQDAAKSIGFRQRRRSISVAAIKRKSRVFALNDPEYCVNYGANDSLQLI
jgi:hypothetical protein